MAGRRIVVADFDVTDFDESPAAWVVPFCDAASEVFLCMLQAACNTETILPADQAPRLEAVTVAIDLSGTGPGRVIISVSERTADQFVERLTGAGAEGDPALLRDIVGEVANMIAGSGKGNLPQLGFLIGTPRPLTAQESLDPAANWPWRRIAILATSLGPCLLDVSWNLSPGALAADNSLPEVA